MTHKVDQARPAMPAIAFCGLNVVRSLGLARIPTIVARYEDFHEVKFSKYTWQYRQIAHPVREEQKCLAQIIDMAKPFSSKLPIFYGDDIKLAFVSRHREVLKDYFHFLLPSPRLLDALLNKAQFIRIAGELQLDVPRSIVANQANSAREVARHLDFPIFVKPNLKKDWRDSPWKHFLQERPHKGFICPTLEELEKNWDALQRISNDFILQEYVFGSDDEILSYHSYVGKDGKVLGAFIGKKIRTFPRGSGASTYLELVHDREVMDAGAECLEKMKLLGISKLDFKRDSHSGNLKLLEVNARANLWNYLGAVNGVNLLEVAYRDLLDLQPKPQLEYRTRYRWISFENDFQALWEYKKFGEWTFFSWLGSLLHFKVYNYFSWRDPKPFLAKVVNFLSKKMISPFGKKPNSKSVEAPSNGHAGNILQTIEADELRHKNEIV